MFQLLKSCGQGQWLGSGSVSDMVIVMEVVGYCLCSYKVVGYCLQLL